MHVLPLLIMAMARAMLNGRLLSSGVFVQLCKYLNRAGSETWVAVSDMTTLALCISNSSGSALATSMGQNF